MISRPIERQQILIAGERNDIAFGEVPTDVVGNDGIPPDQDATTAGLIDNLLDNSDFDFSKDKYLNLIPLGGDEAAEVYAYFRHRMIKVTDVQTTNGSAGIVSASSPFKSSYTYPMDCFIYGAAAADATFVGTLTRVDDQHATLSSNAGTSLPSNGIMWFGDPVSENTQDAIKEPSHSLYAVETANANIPDWDRSNGWVRAGGPDPETWSISFPFAFNTIRPGATVHFLCIIKADAGSTVPTNGVRLGFGIFDDTPGQQKWLEGDNFALTATAVGTTGATSVTYKAIGYLSDGTTIESNEVTVANSNAVLSTSHYNRLTWVNTAGLLDFEIYRLMNGVYSRVFTITNGSSDYNDYGTSEMVVGSFPDTSQTKAIAYVETSPQYPSESGWLLVRDKVTVPATYDSSLTTEKQWFRMVILDDMTPGRSLFIDRVGVNFGFEGGWTRSARDKILFANVLPDATPVGSDQGDIGVIPTCFDEDTLVRWKPTADGREQHIPMVQLDRGDYIWDGTRSFERIKKVKISTVFEQIHVELANGMWWRSTHWERFITSRADKDGTPLHDLTKGDTIISPACDSVTLEPITEYREVHGKRRVVTIELCSGRRIFAVANRCLDGEIRYALAHNRKAE